MLCANIVQNAQRESARVGEDGGEVRCGGGGGGGVVVVVWWWCGGWVGGVGDGGFSKAVATFNHVGGSFNLLMATTGNV